MTDIVKGALGGAWTWLMGFVLPAAVFLGAVAVGSSWADPDGQIATGWWGELKGDSAALALGLGAVVIAMLLLGLNTTIYRLFEGYVLLPRIPWLFTWMTARHLKKRTNLQKQLEKLESENNPGVGLRIGFVIERLANYPLDDSQVGPTRMANAIRSFETYGASRFGLDSQTMWTELLSSAPEPARNEESAAKSYLNFLINLLFLSGAFTVYAGAMWTLQRESQWAWLTVGALLNSLVWWRLVLRAVSDWASTVRALVNLGRIELATKMGFEVPRHLASEVDMWHELVWLIREGPDSSGGDALFRYRSKKKE